MIAITSFTVGCNWTPELIAKDKELKEKYGPDAHIIPAKTTANLIERMPLQDTFLQEKTPVKEKSNKTRNILLTVGGLILTAASLYLFRGNIRNILSKFTGKSAAVENNISERILANGKKVQKIVENTESGAKKVVMNVFDEAGNLVLSKEKIITRSVNGANGKKYINVKNTYNSSGPVNITLEGIPTSFNKKMSVETNKYYNTEGNLSLKTRVIKDVGVPFKERIAYDANGKETFASITNYTNKNGCRSSRSSFENPYTAEVKQTSNKFSYNGTVIKPKN